MADPPSVAALRATVEARIADAGPLGLDLVTWTSGNGPWSTSLTASLTEAGRVRAAAAPDPLADHPYLASLDAQPFAPPPPDGVDRSELRELVRRGLVVAQDGVWFSASAVDAAGSLVARLLVDHPEGVTLAQIRDAMGNTRKHVLPLTALLDARGMTRRRDDLRIAGPRLPATRLSWISALRHASQHVR